MVLGPKDVELKVLGSVPSCLQKRALPVISHSLANAFCKIALDFNNRLLVLEHRAHFVSNCQRSPLALVPLPLLPGALGSEILVGGPGAPERGFLSGVFHPDPSKPLPPHPPSSQGAPRSQLLAEQK